MEDLTNLIGAWFNFLRWIVCSWREEGKQVLNFSWSENEEAAVKLRVNALIKRASLFIQQCKVIYLFEAAWLAKYLLFDTLQYFPFPPLFVKVVNWCAGPQQGPPAQFRRLCRSSRAWSWQCRHLPSQRTGGFPNQIFFSILVSFVMEHLITCLMYMYIVYNGRCKLVTLQMCFPGAPAHRPDQRSHCGFQQSGDAAAQLPSGLCPEALHWLQVRFSFIFDPEV